MGEGTMDASIAAELRMVLRVIFDLRAPEEGGASLRIRRPAGMNILEMSWLEDLVDVIVEGVLVAFDLRRKTENDDPQEIEEWKQPLAVGGWVERRKNHRLRIRTMVDDLFEKNLGLPDVPASVRAWKIQVADTCADVILDRFHVRPASSGPWASFRLAMHDIAQNLQQALGYKDLFLMTGRVSEAKTMETVIEDAYQAVRELVRELEDSGLPGLRT
jgi:hypothetical protein